MGASLNSEIDAGAFNTSGMCLPREKVGGDYYGYLQLDATRLGVVIGDVTGHDSDAARPAAAAQNILHARPSVAREPADVLRAMRSTLDLRMERLLLMSCCYVLLDACRHRLRYVNAGHPYPLLYRRRTGQLERLSSLDPILGAQEMSETSYHQDERGWEPGDLLILYTDGFSEVRDPEGRMIDHAAIEDCVVSNAHRSPTGIRLALLELLYSHARGTVIGDDLTLVVVKAT